MIGIKDVFNKDSLVIFTDASMTANKNTKEQIGCAGCVTVFDMYSNDPYMECQIIRNSTNNNSEIKALRLGVLSALRYRNKYKYIRIFSDSQISIFGIRDRIFNWDLINDDFYGSAGRIKNQEIFAEILNIIIEHDLKIEFYHQKGHVNYNTSSLINAKQVFQASNGVREDIDLQLIKQISYYNNLVDQSTRKFLLSTDLNRANITKEPVYFTGSDFDKSLYYNLTH